MSEYILQMKNIVKEFSSQRVLNEVSLEVKRGEIHALCGENGAGKSTLMKILSGAYPCGEYKGEIWVEGKKQLFHNTKESAQAGIEIIYQELEIVPNMSVAENVFLGDEPLKGRCINYNQIYSDTKKTLEKLKIDIKPDVLVEDLGIGMKQMVAIAKALAREPKVLILDEPSAALTEAETETLLQIVKELSNHGVACVYISHRLEEVLSIADNVTVIRDGNLISTRKRNETDKTRIIKDMVGRELADQFVKEAVDIGETFFEVKNLSVYDHFTNKPIIQDISFDVRKGEIVGIAGLMGAGRTEVAMAIMGLLPGKTHGEITLEGNRLNNKTPRNVIESGIGIVVEDRKQKGLVLGLDIKNNTTITSLEKLSRFGIISNNEVIKWTRHYVKKLNIKARSIEMEVKTLSGGNQQKVVIAKSLMISPKLLILDEPTRGIDVGAKHEIYMIMNDLVRQGVSIIMISSELPEVLAMADRIVVMSQGKVSGILDNVNLQQEEIMHYATLEG